jgi:hypothetical protein
MPQTSNCQCSKFLNNPGNATVGSKIQLISANFKLSRTQKDLSYFVGDTWSRYDFDLGTELHISRWTGDLPLLGSITEDTVSGTVVSLHEYGTPTITLCKS